MCTTGEVNGDFDLKSFEMHCIFLIYEYFSRNICIQLKICNFKVDFKKDED